MYQTISPKHPCSVLSAPESFLPDISFEDFSLPAKTAIPDNVGGQNIKD